MRTATTSTIARIVIITAVLAPWDAAQTVKQPKSEGYSLRGQIIDAGTGRPRSDVEVQLEINYNIPVAPPTKPDANGQFVFTGLKAGRYSLIAKLGNSRIPFGELPSGEFRTVPVGPEDEGKPVIFRLAPDTVIEGTIGDPQGVPIPRGIVTVGKASWQSGQVVVTRVAQEETDELGRYRIPRVRPGSYTVCAMGPPGWVAPPVDTVDYAQGEQHQFYGMNCYLDGPLKLLIKPGDHPRIDLKLPVRSGVTLKGTILGVSQHTYGEVRLYGEMPFTGADVTFGEIRLSGSGDFQFNGLLPGTYRLEAYTNFPSTRTVTTVTTGDTAPPPMEIKPEGVSIIDVVVHAPPGRTPDSIATAISLRPNRLGSSIAEQVQKNGNAPVRFNRLTPGQYWLIIRTNEPLCAVAATLRGHDVLRNPLAITAGIDGHLDITFSDKCGVVSGSVWQRGKAVPYSRLLLLQSGSASQPGDLDNSQISDEDGGFIFDHLAPGRYTLWAWTQDDPSYPGPERLKEVEALGLAVDVRAGETTSVKLEQIRPGGGSK